MLRSEFWREKGTYRLTDRPTDRWAQTSGWIDRMTDRPTRDIQIDKQNLSIQTPYRRRKNAGQCINLC